MTKKPKLVYSIKGKLVSAVCMLLVAMIMVVSSTYAWFTLSTAPEVTGIQTAVGSNGALEMGLLGLNGTVPGATTTSDGVGDNWTVKNLTWGNLVDLTTGYGLDKITLYPSVLNKTGDAIASTGILSIPSYDASGRPGTPTPNTFTGTYDNTAFKVNNNFGVRAIGASSSMTDRQIAYRNYMGDAKDATATATASITQSLKNNGAGLATAAMKIAMNGASAKFTAADVAMIGSILADLEAARADVATALLNYIYATVASKYAQTFLTTDAVWASVDGTMKTKTLDTLVQSKTESGTVNYYVSFEVSGADGATNNVEIPMPASFQAAYAAYIALGTKITNAKAAHQAIAPDASEYTSDEFSGVLNHLVNTSMVTINGMSMSQAKENILGLVSSGVNVQMPSGSGIFADFADLCGNYSAPVSVDGSALDVGVTVNGTLSATMVTTSKVNPAYLKAVNTEVTALLSPDRDNSTTADATLNEFYGYIIDLAFRTNASGSFLRLQTEAVDRIYADNANEATMGHGSSMTFSTTDPSFTPDMIAELMSALRIVFFNPETDGENAGKIYAEARLDMGYTKDAAGNITDRNYEINGSEVTGYMYILLPETEYYVAGTDGAADIILIKVGENYYTSYTDETTNTPYTVADGVTVSERTKMVYATQEEAKIVDLQQGQAQKVSVLVYLDGTIVDNGMVPAQGNMTGSMNLQFSSSVELEPMENGTLHTPAN